MAPRADSAALNVQPRQRRIVYEGLAKVPEGRSAKDLIAELDIPEAELRETLRKLDSAGLAHRTKGIWKAVPLEPADAGSEDPAVTSAPPAPAA
jgi:predicted ArsR family transcriptional regulator